MTFRKICMAASMIVAGTFSAAASDIVVSDTIVDNVPGTHNGTPGAFSYIGEGSSKDHMGGSKYDIYDMQVSRSNVGIMTVRINTKFVDINAIAQNGSKYYYGDLFMSTTGWNPTGNASDGYQADNFYTTGTQWDYAYDLNGARYTSGSFTDNSSAKLRKLDSSYSAGDFNMGSVRTNQIYRGNNSLYDGSAIGGGSVEANIGGDYLEFIFDVSGTGLATAEQIAFRWALSCANDIIEGAVVWGHNVPTPAVFGLMLLGLTGIGFTRRRKQKL